MYTLSFSQLYELGAEGERDSHAANVDVVRAVGNVASEVCSDGSRIRSAGVVVEARRRAVRSVCCDRRASARSGPRVGQRSGVQHSLNGAASRAQLSDVVRHPAGRDAGVRQRQSGETRRDALHVEILSVPALQAKAAGSSVPETCGRLESVAEIGSSTDESSRGDLRAGGVSGQEAAERKVSESESHLTCSPACPDARGCS